MVLVDISWPKNSILLLPKLHLTGFTVRLSLNSALRTSLIVAWCSRSVLSNGISWIHIGICCDDCCFFHVFLFHWYLPVAFRQIPGRIQELTIFLKSSHILRVLYFILTTTIGDALGESDLLNDPKSLYFLGFFLRLFPSSWTGFDTVFWLYCCFSGLIYFVFDDCGISWFIWEYLTVFGWSVFCLSALLHLKF